MADVAVTEVVEVVTVAETVVAVTVTDSGSPGTPGPAIELQASSTHIQYRIVGEPTWINLVALSELEGPEGQGVPTGGTAGQKLVKVNGVDFNTQWADDTGGGVWGEITGTLSAQTDLQSALDAKALSSRTVNGHPLTSDVTVSKSDVGLGSVDNTADTAKPVSTLQAAADAAVLSSAQSYADGKVADNLTASTTVAPSKSAVNTALGLKVTANAAITPATKTKLTYDAAGLVTSGADATTADIADSSNKRYVTDAQLTTIGNTSGTNTGDNATNSQYSGLVSNATHTGDATGATALTVVALNGVNLAGLATGVLKNTTGTGVPSIATGADLPAMSATVGGAVPTPPNNTTTFLRGDGTFAAPVAAVSGAVRQVSFGTGAFNTTLAVADATITASDSVLCSIVSGSTMTAEEAAIQSVTASAIITAGVGYTIHCAAPLGAIGTIGVIALKLGV